jgi:hypothetical protein
LFAAFLEQVDVPANSPIAGQTLGSARVHARTGALVLALRHPDEGFIANPPPEAQVGAGDVLVVIGNVSQIDALRSLTEVLPDTGIVGGFEIAERIRLSIADITLPGVDVSVTVSLGVAGFPDHANTPERLERLADAALYLAKRQGRNRTEVADPAHESASTDVVVLANGVEPQANAAAQGAFPVRKRSIA